VADLIEDRGDTALSLSVLGERLAQEIEVRGGFAREVDVLDAQQLGRELGAGFDLRWDYRLLVVEEEAPYDAY
jgi:hypothetical protein